jgi:flagellar protein FliS
MDGIEAYKENSVATQSSGRLVVLLYEGAIRFLKQAIKEMEERDYADKGKYIGKAIDVIDELNYCLDVEVGGETAMNLRKLYFFMTRHLNEAHLRQDPVRVREVIALLEDLNQAWKALTV